MKDGKPRQGHDTREGKEFSQEKRAGFGLRHGLWGSRAFADSVTVHLGSSIRSVDACIVTSRSASVSSHEGP